MERNADKRTRPAILFDDRSITWAELDAWSNRIAHYLKNQGLVKGDAIAVARRELLATVVGAAKVSVACAMLNTSQKGKVLAHQPDRAATAGGW